MQPIGCLPPRLQEPQIPKFLRHAFHCRSRGRGDFVCTAGCALEFDFPGQNVGLKRHSCASPASCWVVSSAFLKQTAKCSLVELLLLQEKSEFSTCGVTSKLAFTCHILSSTPNYSKLLVLSGEMVVLGGRSASLTCGSDQRRTPPQLLPAASWASSHSRNAIRMRSDQPTFISTATTSNASSIVGSRGDTADISQHQGCANIRARLASLGLFVGG